MGFKTGIVGLPNVGKSTLFNALTKAGIGAENYPFCTIEPNVGVVPVNDPRLNRLAAIVKPQQIIPTSMQFVDIAGLVAGASRGEGLGNKFLANIRETEAIGHVVRCFEDEDIVHVAGRIDPAGDIEVINTELCLADLDSVEKALSKTAKQAKAGGKEAAARAAVLEQARDWLDQGKPIRSLGLDAEQRLLIRDLFLLTIKPMLYIANVAEDGFHNNPALSVVEAIAAAEGSEVVAISAAVEAEIAELNPEEAQEFLQSMGLEEPGLDRLIRAGHHLLGLHSYFTAGPKEVRAWTIPIGASAPQAAGVIHSDFERGFIRAEVIAFADYIACGGEQGAKEVGKLRSEGKDYIVQDGDVIHFRFNV